MIKSSGKPSIVGSSMTPILEAVEQHARIPYSIRYQLCAYPKINGGNLVFKSMSDLGLD